MKQSKCLIIVSILAALAVVTRSQVADKKARNRNESETGALRAQFATFMDSNKVAAAFAKGMPLIETDTFKVHASRRDAAGVVEIHGRDTDIFYLLEGSATFVTGGTAVDPKNVAADEIRGTEIRDGESRRVSKGDVIIVPPGVPHWFKTVEGPLVYYVVKVTSANSVRK